MHFEMVAIFSLPQNAGAVATDKETALWREEDAFQE